MTTPGTNYDILIIGAGPGGCSAALKLAPAGLKIALVDKAALPGNKICGDALSGTVLSVLKRMPGGVYDRFLGIPEKLPSRGIRFFSPAMEKLDVPFMPEHPIRGEEPGYICRRREFERFLLEEAERYPNIRLIPEFTVRGITRNKEGFTVRGDTDQLSANFIVGADGLNSVAGKQLAGNPADKRNDCIGIRAYFSGVTGLHPEGFIELIFLKELLPGYLWIFPMKGGQANVGFGMMYKDLKNNPGSMTARFMRLIHEDPFIKHRFMDSVMEGKPEAHGLPLGPSGKSISGDRFLLVGDAASLVDPFTGEGIGNAMRSGELAGEMILRAFEKEDFSAGFLREYDHKIHEKIGRELKNSRTIQRLAGNRALFDFVVRKASRNRELQNLFTRMFTDPDARKELTRPLFYLRLLFRQG